ncbi:sporulation protein YjcZ [Paenibacillus dendritiformis]
MAPAAKPAPVYPGFWTSTGTILVLYILLVIILRAPYC